MILKSKDMWDVLIALNMLYKNQVSILSPLGMRYFHKYFGRRLVNESQQCLQSSPWLGPGLVNNKTNIKLCSLCGGYIISFTVQGYFQQSFDRGSGEIKTGFYSYSKFVKNPCMVTEIPKSLQKLHSFQRWHMQDNWDSYLK